jgi:uncharacterized protein (TIGR02268 family)
MTWLSLALVLGASAAAAQPQPTARQRQDRRAVLPTTPAEPMLELYVAGGHLTTAAFNGRLDPDSLVVDRTRFKWAEASEHLLMLEPFSDLGPGERLIVQVSFKDRALPTRAVLAVLSRADVMDGKVELDRRANSPEALLAALKQKEAELEELKTRYAGSGPAGLMLSGWLSGHSHPVYLKAKAVAGGTHGLTVGWAHGYQGEFSALVGFSLRNLPGQKPWVLEQARITGAAGARVEVLSVQMKQPQLEPGEEGLVVVEVKTPPWTDEKPFSLELMDPSGQRSISIKLRSFRK